MKKKQLLPFNFDFFVYLQQNLTAIMASISNIRFLFSLPQIPKSHPCPPIPFFPKTQLEFDQKPITLKRAIASSTEASSSSLYSAKVYDLTAENVNLVLDDVRPYLIADGGDVDVVGVEDGVISLKLQGACGSCPSSTTTMKMGIERVLKEKFGEAVKDIRQVSDDPQISTTTVEAVNGHLDALRPAIKNYGGSVEVVSVEGGSCRVRYVGPDSIGSGIRAAIKERFPDIADVIFLAG